MTLTQEPVALKDMAQEFVDILHEQMVTLEMDVRDEKTGSASDLLAFNCDFKEGDSIRRCAVLMAQHIARKCKRDAITFVRMVLLWEMGSVNARRDSVIARLATLYDPARGEWVARFDVMIHYRAESVGELK